MNLWPLTNEMINSIVKESIDNAVQDGYKEEIQEMNEVDLTHDLMAYVDQLENAPYLSVLRSVMHYRGLL